MLVVQVLTCVYVFKQLISIYSCIRARIGLIFIKCVNVPVRLLQRQSSGSTVHSFNQGEIREKLQAFPGGSIDLLKQESGVAVLTINNPSRMNAFSGRVTLCVYIFQ